MNTPGETARKVRKKLDISGPQLAKKIGLSQAWLSNFENDKGGAKVDDVCRLCKGLGITLYDLYGSASGSDSINGEVKLDLPLNPDTYRLFVETISDVHSAISLINNDCTIDSLSIEDQAKFYMKSLFLKGTGAPVKVISELMKMIDEE